MKVCINTFAYPHLNPPKPTHRLTQLHTYARTHARPLLYTPSSTKAPSLKPGCRSDEGSVLDGSGSLSDRDRDHVLVPEPPCYLVIIFRDHKTLHYEIDSSHPDNARTNPKVMLERIADQILYLVDLLYQEETELQGRPSGIVLAKHSSAPMEMTDTKANRTPAEEHKASSMPQESWGDSPWQ